MEKLAGLVFTHPETGETYGCIRVCEGAEQSHPATRVHWTPVAEDDCGNAFVVSPEGCVAFWDHESDEIIELAPDWAAFVQGCAEHTPVELDRSKVESVWVDPSFAKEHGIDVDKDGRKKKP